MLVEMIVGVVRRNKYAEYVCTNESCDEGEFAARIPPIYVEMPRCPGCGCSSLLLEVLSRAG